MPVLPELNDDQKRAGYEASLAIRRQRASLKQSISEEKISFGEAIEMECAQQMKLPDLLRAVPGVGERKARRILDDLGISPERTVAQLGPHQKLRLASYAKAML